MADEKSAKSPLVEVTAAETTDIVSNTDRSKEDVERSSPTHAVSLWSYLSTEVDPAQCTPQMAAFCFMTGFTDAVCFSAIFVWCGFQTGNFAQLALAVGRLFEGPPGHRDLIFHKADQQALCSLLGFNAGAFVGRIGDKIGAKKRIWIILGTFISALFTMIAAVTLWKSGQPSLANERLQPAWTNALTFVAVATMSMSLGIQGIVCKRLNTQFGTTIVLTTIWVELMCDPRLFKLGQRVMTRDHRVIGAFSLFLGAFVGRAILYQIGAAGTLGIGVGIRILITLSWIFSPSKAQRS